MNKCKCNVIIRLEMEKIKEENALASQLLTTKLARYHHYHVNTFEGQFAPKNTHTYLFWFLSKQSFVCSCPGFEIYASNRILCLSKHKRKVVSLFKNNVLVILSHSTSMFFFSRSVTTSANRTKTVCMSFCAQAR